MTRLGRSCTMARTPHLGLCDRMFFYVSQRLLYSSRLPPYSPSPSSPLSSPTFPLAPAKENKYSHRRVDCACWSFSSVLAFSLCEGFLWLCEGHCLRAAVVYSRRSPGCHGCALADVHKAVGCVVPLTFFFCPHAEVRSCRHEFFCTSASPQAARATAGILCTFRLLGHCFCAHHWRRLQCVREPEHQIYGDTHTHTHTGTQTRFGVAGVRR